MELLICQTRIPMLKDKKVFVFFDEVTFYLHELVNIHNIRYWCETNPCVTIESSVKSLKLNICYAMSKTQLIGPFFFEDNA